MVNKIRFNLGRGDNYKKWQIRTSSGEVIYINPKTTIIKLIKVKLINNKTSAEKIYNGSNKFVCAWIEFENYEILEVFDGPLTKPLTYNPRIESNWFDCDGNDIDNMEYDTLITLDNKVYEVNLIPEDYIYN